MRCVLSPAVALVLGGPLVGCSTAARTHSDAGRLEAGKTDGGARDGSLREASAIHDAREGGAADGLADAASDAPLVIRAATDAAILGPDGAAFVPAAWNTAAGIAVDGFAAAAAGDLDCRDQVCQHNEDTDMIAWQGALYYVHRTARSQVLGPNSSLLVYKSVDQGTTFVETARIQAPLTPIDADDPATTGRDIRDPSFFVVKAADGTETLHLKAITRLPTNLAVVQTRDSNVSSISVGFTSKDGATWSPLARLAPTMWSFWRVKEIGGVFFSAAYHDGDVSVSLFSSPDGVTWTQGAEVYGVSADTPLETELLEMPNGNLLALVRTDGDDASLAANNGMQETRVCWASPPFASFDCGSTLVGQRFDGPVDFFWNGRLFVIARRHVDTDGVRNRKRTSLFELTPGRDGGTWNDQGPLSVTFWGDLPSAGDTAYAGIAFIDANRARVGWYSGDVEADLDWYVSLLGPTNIWLGTIDFSRVH